MNARRDNDGGAALLTVLLLVAVMSVAALTATQIIGVSIQNSRAAQSSSTVNWQLVGAEQFGEVALGQLRDATGGELNDSNIELLGPFEFLLPSGALLGQVREASNCLNLNALRNSEDASGAVDDSKLVRLQLLVETLGIEAFEAEALADALADWIDGDVQPRLRGAEDGYYATLDVPYRAANQPLADLSELRAVLGYSADLVRVLRPFVCAYPTSADVTLNINTLRAEDAPLLVVATSGEISLEMATAIIGSRPPGGWADVVSLLQHEDLRGISPELIVSDMLGINSEYLELVGVVEMPDSTTPFRVLYSLAPTERVRVLRRQYGERL